MWTNETIEQILLCILSNKVTQSSSYHHHTKRNNPHTCIIKLRMKTKVIMIIILKISVLKTEMYYSMLTSTQSYTYKTWFSNRFDHCIAIYLMINVKMMLIYGVSKERRLLKHFLYRSTDCHRCNLHLPSCINSMHHSDVFRATCSRSYMTKQPCSRISWCASFSLRSHSPPESTTDRL